MVKATFVKPMHRQVLRTTTPLLLKLLFPHDQLSVLNI